MLYEIAATGQLFNHILVNLGSDNNFLHFFSLFPNHFIFHVNCAKSSTVNCSARLSKIESCKIVSSNKFLTALRNFFLRWLNAVFTSKKKSFWVLKAGVSDLGINLITALFTFGGGEKDFSFTSNK